MYDVAIWTHAASGVAGFIIGLALIFQADIGRQRWLARALLVCLVLLEVSLLTAMAAHWRDLPTISQIIFAALAALALYMTWRGLQALRVLERRSGDPLPVIDHVGFVLISLFDGFAIVLALDLGAPSWLVALIAVGAVVVGIYGINLRKRQIAVRS